jgi:hypothetical protein
MADRSGTFFCAIQGWFYFAQWPLPRAWHNPDSARRRSVVVCVCVHILYDCIIYVLARQRNQHIASAILPLQISLWHQVFCPECCWCVVLITSSRLVWLFFARMAPIWNAALLSLHCVVAVCAYFNVSVYLQLSCPARKTLSAQRVSATHFQCAWERQRCRGVSLGEKRRHIWAHVGNTCRWSNVLYLYGSTKSFAMQKKLRTHGREQQQRSALTSYCSKNFQ